MRRRTDGAAGQHLVLVENHVEAVGHVTHDRAALVDLDGELVVDLVVACRRWLGDVAEDEGLVADSS